MATFMMTRGDSSPAMRYALPDGVNLEGATVVFNMPPVLVRAPAQVARVSPPTVQYDWQPGDTAGAGLYRAEFEVTFAGGRVETFPPAGSAWSDRLAVHIADDLG